MKIEWASEFRDDGSRRRPPPSKMHGWLAKWRGTFSGNEELRSRGIREMKDADKRKREIKARNGGTFSRLFTTSKKPASSAARPPARHLSKSKPPSSSSARPAPSSRSGSSRGASRPSASRQPTRSSHRSGSSRDRPSNSRRSTRR